MSVRQELRDAAYRAGGSFKTRENRTSVCSRFADYLRNQNIHITRLSHIKTAYVEAYIRSGLERGLKARTLQSELSALKTTLTAAGRGLLAANLNTTALGIAGASRKGSKTAMGEGKVCEILKAAQEKDAGVAACIRLQRALGLRAKEAIMSPPSLQTWRQSLESGRPIRVIHGTKGGRTRDVIPSDRESAAAAVRSALALSEAQGGTLIHKPNLKSALSRYSRVMHEIGATGKETGHSLRYSFAQQQLRAYEAAGYSHHEALAMTSLDLGHGDGRGRWVKTVYSL